jgi:hypothetical protein
MGLDNISENERKLYDDLLVKYNHRLNFTDDVNLWLGSKFDYRCYPKQILIQPYILK